MCAAVANLIYLAMDTRQTIAGWDMCPVCVRICARICPGILYQSALPLSPPQFHAKDKLRGLAHSFVSGITCGAPFSTLHPSLCCYWCCCLKNKNIKWGGCVAIGQNAPPTSISINCDIIFFHHYYPFCHEHPLRFHPLPCLHFILDLPMLIFLLLSKFFLLVDILLLAPDKYSRDGGCFVTVICDDGQLLCIWCFYFCWVCWIW